MASFSTGGIGLNGHMGSTVSKRVGFRKGEIKKIQKMSEHELKWVQNNDPGVSRGQERSKLRPGSIGRPPGGQKHL